MVFHDYPTTSFKILIEKEKVVTVGGVSAQHLYTSIVQAGELLDSLPQIAESMQCRQRQKQFFSGPPLARSCTQDTVHAVLILTGR